MSRLLTYYSCACKKSSTTRNCPAVLSSPYIAWRKALELGMPVVENSQHVFGRAADVQLPEGWTVEQLAELAEECGADGIGVYDWGVHVDTRGYIARW